jgi:2-oxoglutarate ferredoxin oxidoreductase subunit gamma
VVNRYEVQLAGSGGQGLITAGIILAEAAIHDGLNVVQTASYGPESRGGASRSEVIIGSGLIDYPAVTRPDFLLCMTEEAATRFAPHTQDNGIILFDSSWVNDLPESSPGEHYFYPLTEKSSLTFSRPVFANIIAIGFLVTKTKVLSFSGAEVALRKRVPAKYLDANLGALHLGAEIAGTLRPGASAEHPVD